MIADPTELIDPNVTLEWDIPTNPDDTYQEGERETGMTVLTVPFEPIPGENFAHDLTIMGGDIADYVDEMFDHIVRSDEIQFQEVCAQLYLVTQNTKKKLGMLCWRRLENTLGFMLASESEERNSIVARWSIKIGCDYYKLDQYIRAAKTATLVPETSDMTITAQAEIGRNAGDDEDEQRETIRERAENVKELDPTLENTTQTVRDVKNAEVNGNKRPRLYRMKDLSEFRHIADEVVMGQIKTGEVLDEETGAYEDVYEYMPIMRVFFDEPNSEENRPQFEDYKKLLLRRIGVKTHQ